MSHSRLHFLDAIDNPFAPIRKKPEIPSETSSSETNELSQAEETSRWDKAAV